MRADSRIVPIVPFLVAFKGKTDIPIVQVSLPGDSSAHSSGKLGQALSALRDEGYTIIATGQVVHNLRDYCESIVHFHIVYSGEGEIPSHDSADDANKPDPVRTISSTQSPEGKHLHTANHSYKQSLRLCHPPKLLRNRSTYSNILYINKLIQHLNISYHSSWLLELLVMGRRLRSL